MVKGKGGERQTFASIVVDWDTARSDIGALLRVRDVGEYNAAGQAISDLEFCHSVNCFPFLL